MATLLEFRNVFKKYGRDTTALSDVSFSVEAGAFVSVIGPSGAGKSTLLRCINRMVDASRGEIVFDGINTQSLKKRDLRKLRTKIGMIFQHYNLVNRLSVIENVLHGRLGYKSTIAGVLGLYKEEEKRQAFELLSVLGLEEQVYKRCDQLSGGQKQRVGIARALIQNPKMLLCDEPIASLDPNASKVIMEHLKDISSTMGITVLINLHQVEVALKYSDQVIGLNGGRVVYDGSPEHITHQEIRRIYGSRLEDDIVDLGEKSAG
ncbi:phosphonate ABC transporter ATP-binding protein [Novibacillus thermophilus]|jgi:phosphonate transport system ATP-binding protein|uniref:Phosphonate ABC transporter ATP-binding protein n=1 Tax=Novibacillus thermophilus TaxID=1471761 RepID=A0A1U9KA70_9BACL|nr:phosphonate ABC transporter ATP-binding protein [Novibacillus thermophilus]AQS56916.1 phosphonate ABC transporter ATP-binding protein [Novibacillus thermophilus]